MQTRCAFKTFHYVLVAVVIGVSQHVKYSPRPHSACAQSPRNLLRSARCIARHQADRGGAGRPHASPEGRREGAIRSHSTKALMFLMPCGGGGALGSGAPKRNQNALKCGLYTAEALAERRLLRLLIRQGRATIEQLKL